MLKILMSPWTAALALQGILLFVLLFKRMWQRFPVFCAYSIVSFLSNFMLYSFAHFFVLTPVLRAIYLTTYWMNEGLGLTLGLAVVHEVFKHLFTPYPALRKLARQSLQGCIALLVALGFVIAYLQPSGAASQSVFFVLEQATRILEIGLLLSLFALASAFGLHWRQYVFGIALGLGVFVAVELVAVTMRLQFGVTTTRLFVIIRTISYSTSLLIWIGYILAPELKQNPEEMPKRSQLEQWNRAVMELIYQ